MPTTTNPSLKAMVENGLFGSFEELKDQFEHIKGQNGTRIVIYHLTT